MTFYAENITLKIHQRKQIMKSIYLHCAFTNTTIPKGKCSEMLENIKRIEQFLSLRVR
jgi:hypothetical protein